MKPFTVLLPEKLITAIKEKGKEYHRATGPQIRYTLELLYGEEEGKKKPSKVAAKDGHTQAG